MGIYLVKKTKFQTKLGAHKQPSQPTETVLQDGLIVRTLWYKYKPFSHGAESAHPNCTQDGPIVRTLSYKYKPFSHEAESAHPNFI